MLRFLFYFLASLENKPYLDGVEGDIVHVVHHTEKTVRKSNKCSSEQQEYLMLIHTHLSWAVCVENKSNGIKLLDYFNLVV